jgi:acetyl-CoA carboxylase biotin carboxylase subunit
MKKLLVANRGEIALRVMRTAREMGIETVAVYSEPDRFSPHVRYADEAYCLGAGPSKDSYLRGDEIVKLCRKIGADAIHPGYGFLAENAAFARLVRDFGITFVGPSPEAMDQMGSKLAAKTAVKAFGVPLVPGLDTAISDVAAARQTAIEIGFPVLIKASAGGGGKGMRIVEKAEEFEEQMQLAINEAQNAFGDGSVFIEKYVRKPRHIEIQVLADNYGNVVYLFERECSIQRRHQKLIEEAPSSLLTPELRQKMGEAAVNVCKACQYTNAGTVEFLVDADNHFYFLEMNTRLQVEHPVTEMITGLDLVREQIRIARGEPLGYNQEALQIRGHSIEVRVCAEDPTNNFLPDIGKLEVYQRPAGPGVRVDDGYESGMEIPIFYDPMIAKLIVHAGNREQAIARMIRAIDEYKIIGVHTTLAFCRFVLLHPHFIAGDFDTGFIAQHFKPEVLEKLLSEPDTMPAALAAALISNDFQPKPAEAPATEPVSIWRLNRL